MINQFEAKIEAWSAIADLMGLEYFRSHFDDSTQTYPLEEENRVIYDCFLGFESKGECWTVFAIVSVNRETKEVTFLDYKTPDGKRMENPIKPISFA